MNRQLRLPLGSQISHRRETFIVSSSNAEAVRALDAWPTTLPDLRSRLNALHVAELGPPDDELLEGVLQKFFRERLIRPSDDIFPYLIRRMERSVPVALALVEKLDEAADAEHRPISRALARQIIEGDSDTGDLFATPLAKPSPWRDNS